MELPAEDPALKAAAEKLCKELEEGDKHCKNDLLKARLQLT